jgi:hypothetical protein
VSDFSAGAAGFAEVCATAAVPSATPAAAVLKNSRLETMGMMASWELESGTVVQVSGNIFAGHSMRQGFVAAGQAAAPMSDRAPLFL